MAKVLRDLKKLCDRNFLKGLLLGIVLELSYVILVYIIAYIGESAIRIVSHTFIFSAYWVLIQIYVVLFIIFSIVKVKKGNL